MYHLLLIFHGETDQLLIAALRQGTVHASRGAVAVLRRLVRAHAAGFRLHLASSHPAEAL